MTAQARRAVQKRYYDSHPEQRMLEQAKYRAKQEGCSFDLTREDIVIPRTCPVLNIELESGTGSRTDASPSLDRLDPSKGYVKGNVFVCSWRANRLKQDATLEEIVRIALYVVENSGTAAK